MAITLIATAGSATANTYSTLVEAETYFEGRLYTTNWDADTDPDKNKALAWATRLLDQLIEWDGSYMTSTQALRWPRGGVTTPDGVYLDTDAIPDFLQQATAEFAACLLDENRTSDPDTLGFKEIAISSLELKIDKSDRKSVIPTVVWNIIKFYGVKLSNKGKTLVRC